MKPMVCLWLVLTITAGNIAQAQFIYLRISIKVILDPATGQPPTGASNEEILTTLANANLVLDSYQRGYRFQIQQPIPIGRQGDTTGPSRWYAVDFHRSDGEGDRDALESTAKGDADYHWDYNAINLYINQATLGGFCSLLRSTDDIVIIGGQYMKPPTLLHESSHFFDVCHTHGCCDECPDCPPGNDDGFTDTIADSSCWNIDQLSSNSFGMVYTNLPPDQRRQVDTVWGNLMSYHPESWRMIMTEQQLDQFADVATGSRGRVATGSTIVVDRNNTCDSPAGGSRCTVFGNGGPYPLLILAVSAARHGGGDILLMRPGNFNESITIAKPLTLRATRTGPAIIGRP